jgi:glycosyltransferase involved in cell wall biosynthesis
MRILFVSSSYSPVLGGLQTTTHDLAQHLLKNGHQIEVIANRYPRSLPAAETMAGVAVTRWHFIDPRLQYLRNGRFDLFLAGLFYFPLTFFRLLARIHRTKPDVVNLHFVRAPTLFVLIAHCLRPFRLVVSFHGDDVEGFSQRTAFDKWVCKAILRRADAVTTCSRYLLNQLAKVAPTVTDKARAVHYGLHTPLAEASVNTARSSELVSAGRMVPKKGLDVLLRAVALMQDESQLTLMGDGPEKDTLKSLAKEIGVDNRVTFQPTQSRAQVLAAMATCKMVIIPSRLEPFGMVALEAMSQGKPIVASKVGGLPEFLEGADAVLVAPDDPLVLAKAIEEVIGRLANNPDFGARNRELAEKFTLERMMNGYLDAYCA